jgi:hypothetical protein
MIVSTLLKCTYQVLGIKHRNPPCQRTVVVERDTKTSVIDQRLLHYYFTVLTIPRLPPPYGHFLIIFVSNRYLLLRLIRKRFLLMEQFPVVFQSHSFA